MDKYFNIDDEMMVEYSEMTSFDFNSGSYLAVSAQKEEYSHQPTFKYGNYDVLDLLKSMFSRTSTQKA